MSTTDFASTAPAETTAGDGAFRFAHWGAVRKVALAIYLVVLVWWSAEYGIPVQRELVVAWTCGALVCVSLGRHPRQILQLVLDWAPILIVLAAYDLTRGAADSLGIGAHVHPMIDFDKAVFFGETPTEWIQARLYHPGVVDWYDVGFTLTYTSYFIVPFALAGWLWARDHPAFLRFRRRLVTLALAGLATYMAFPAAPPWMAGEMGLLHGVHRTTSEGWQVLGVGTASLFSEGQRVANAVAAVPSLHAGFTMLVALFLWDRVPWRWARPLLLLYPLAMGFSLIATGEHYFFDVLLGWIYAGTIMATWASWERRRAGTALGMADFKKGDKVKWKSHGGEGVGEVERKITADTEAGGRTVRASEDEPQYLVRSEKSGGTAVHKPEALKRA